MSSSLSSILASPASAACNSELASDAVAATVLNPLTWAAKAALAATSTRSVATEPPSTRAEIARPF